VRSHTLAAAALLALAACAGPRREEADAARSTAEAPAENVVRVARDSAGKTLTLRTGARLEVALESNPTTGYSWQRDGGDSTVIASGGARFEPENAQPGVVGAGGTEVLAFRAAAPGRTRLVLAYRQPWKGGAASGERWEADVVVRP
jgi:inhibitor of cysteine peptidase